MENHLKGIGGWLILVAIGLIIAPITAAAYIFNDLMPLYDPTTWHLLTTFGTQAYHPLFAPLIVYETVFNIFLIVAPISLLVLMFKKSPKYPKLMITYLIVVVITQIIDVVFVYKVYSDLPILSEEQNNMGTAFQDTLRIIVQACIWIPYFIKSKRVKMTFLNMGIDSFEEVAPAIEDNTIFVEVEKAEKEEVSKAKKIGRSILSFACFLGGVLIVKLLLGLW